MTDTNRRTHTLLTRTLNPRYTATSIHLNFHTQQPLYNTYDSHILQLPHTASLAILQLQYTANLKHRTISSANHNSHTP